MRIRPWLALLVLMGAAMPAAAQYDAGSGAGQLSYTWLEGRLVAWDPDRGDDLDGVRIGGSGRIQDNLFAVAGLSFLDADGPGDWDALDLGLGVRQPLSSVVDAFAIAGLVYVETDGFGRDDDDTGLALTGGVRAIAAPQIELAGYLKYQETFGDGDFHLGGDVFVHATPNLSFVAGLSLSDDIREISLGGRWSFVPLF